MESIFTRDRKIAFGISTFGISLRLQSLLLVLSLIGILGCSDPLAPDYAALGLVPIYGKIQLDGKPLPGAVIMLEATDRTWSYGTTDASGNYRLKFNSECMGVLVGEKIVRISTTASTGEEDEYEEDENGVRRPPKKELVPEVYFKESKLRVNITPKMRELNFDLKSDGSTEGPTK